MNARPCSCGAFCDRAGTPGEPCWGEVGGVDVTFPDDPEGDEVWTHACEGHVAALLEPGCPYQPEPVEAA